jgi:outer membrane lipoprotein carrier protein
VGPRITFEIDRNAAAVANMEAQFTHSFTPRGFKKAQIENGTVIFGKLPAMRWTYSKPEPKTWVFDGTRYWFYVPSDKQVTVGQIDEQKKHELPFLMIGDAHARDVYFEMGATQKGNTLTTTLKPRDPAAQIRVASITADARSHLIQSIEYTDRDGNLTHFDFSGYHPARVSADTFSFAVPAGVQVVRGD